MKRIDARTVILTDHERHAADRFSELLDEGHGMNRAVQLLFPQYPDVSAEFLAWLIH